MSGEVETIAGESAETPSHELLRQIIERVERLDSEISDLRADRSDLLKEAKAQGFDRKALDEVLRRRKMEPRQRAQLDDIVAVYEEAVRGQPRGTIWGGELRPQIAPPKSDRRSQLALAALAAADAVGRAEEA